MSAPCLMSSQTLPGCRDACRQTLIETAGIGCADGAAQWLSRFIGTPLGGGTDIRAGARGLSLIAKASGNICGDARHQTTRQQMHELRRGNQMSAKLHALWHKQGGLCFYCGAETYLPGGGETKDHARQRFGIIKGTKKASKAFRRRYATREHLKRKADGGTMANENLVMACHGCNVRRGEMSVEAYKNHVADQVRLGCHPTLHASQAST